MNDKSVTVISQPQELSASPVTILKAGQSVEENMADYFSFDLDEVIQRYYVYQNGKSLTSSVGQDILTQAQYYRYAVSELLEVANELWSSTATEGVKEEETGEYPLRILKEYDQLYTCDGEVITSVLDIGKDVKFLIAGKKG